MKKRLFSPLLALCMVLMLLPAMSEAADSLPVGLKYSINGDTVTITDYTGAATELVIPATIEGKNVTTIGDSAFYKCTSLKSITIPDGVTTIGKKAFCKCTSLTSVTIPDSVTTIGDSAFYDCISITSVTIGDSVTKIGDYAFQNCPIKKLIIADGSETVTSTMVVCEITLEEVVIPASVTTIGDKAFRGCGGLTSITIPASVTTIGDEAFSSCDGLTSITIPDGVTTIGSFAFQYCASLKSITIPDGVTTIGSFAFYYCDGLTSVTIGDSVATIGKEAFYNCTSLTGITIPDSVTTIGYAAFSNCTSLAYNQHHNGYYLGNAGNPYLALIAAVDTGITSCQIHENTKVIGGGAFSGCGNLTNITIPDSVTAISDFAFDECHDLTSVTIPDSVTTIGKFAFYNCGGLTSVTIGDSVTTIGDHAFYSCTSLTSITFTGNLPTIGEDCFLYTPHTTAYYPCGDTTWTETKLQNHGGSITWMVEHHYVDGVCPGCGKMAGAVDGVYRLAGSNRFDTAFKSADALKEVMGVEKFPAAIVTSGMNFADALAGSYLAAVTGAPILLTDNDNMADVIAYIRENVEAGGTVYALGGTAVVADTLKVVKNSGYQFKRLAGSNRFETNLMILEEAGIRSGDPILVCTAYNFADSLSASALGLPILLVDDAISAEQKAFLRENVDGGYILVGGTGAVTSTVENQLKVLDCVERLAGSNRFETSVLTAIESFGNSVDSAVLAYGYNFPDGLCAGPLAYALGAPLILTATGDEGPAAVYATSVGINSGFVLGGPSLISGGVAYRIFSTSNIQ